MKTDYTSFILITIAFFFIIIGILEKVLEYNELLVTCIVLVVYTMLILVLIEMDLMTKARRKEKEDENKKGNKMLE